MFNTILKKKPDPYQPEEGNNDDWPYVDTQKGNNVDTLLGTFPTV